MTTVFDGNGTNGRRTVRIALDPPVPGIHAGELAKRIFFISEAITDFSLVRVQGDICAVDLAIGDAGPAAPGLVPGTGAVDPAEFERKLRFVLANDVLGQRPVEPKVIWRRPAASSPQDIFGDLLARGIASVAGEGQVAVGEPVLSLMDYLDTRVRALTMTEFGAREFRYPTLTPVAVLERCGYLESFPQLMMFVSRLHGDVDVYRQFTDDMADGRDLADRLRTGCGNFDHCLPPTMCFHTYHQLADRALPTPSMVVTSRGKSFRFESRYQRSLERLWDFTIREIVFLGSADWVVRSRARLMERTFDLVTELGLTGHCEVANDPFFVSTGTADRVWSQQLMELKYELRLPLEPGRDVAVCSFNYHGQFFGQCFGIGMTNGGAAHTACAGFGLERFAYAYLCQHGLDPAGWPAAVRQAVAP